MTNKITLEDKVKKLLNLANHANTPEDEKILALAMAQRLALKYNLDLDNLKNDEVIDREIIDRGIKMVFVEEDGTEIPFKNDPDVDAVAHILSKFFMVRVYYRITSDYSEIHLVGTKSNATIAESIFWFLLREIENRWFSDLKTHKKERKETKAPPLHFGSWCIGFKEEIYKKLEMENENLNQIELKKALIEDVKSGGTANENKVKSEQRALALVPQNEMNRIDEWISQNLSLRRSSSRAKKFDSSSAERGRAQGRQVQFRKQLS